MKDFVTFARTPSRKIFRQGAIKFAHIDRFFFQLGTTDLPPRLRLPPITPTSSSSSIRRMRVWRGVWRGRRMMRVVMATLHHVFVVHVGLVVGREASAPGRGRGGRGRHLGRRPPLVLDRIVCCCSSVLVLEVDDEAAAATC